MKQGQIKLKFLASVVFFISFGSFSFSQENPPGIIEGLKVLVDDSREKLQKRYQELQSSGNVLTNPSEEEVKELAISDLFLRSIFLHSEKKYLEMIGLNECHLFALFENKLLKTALGTVDYLMVKKGDQDFLIRSNVYTEQVYKYKCQAFAQISKIFTRASLKKTVLSLKYPVPKTEKQCSEILNDWKKNNYLPYLCKIPHAIKLSKTAQSIKSKTPRSQIATISRLNDLIEQGNYFNEELPFFQRSYLKNLCDGVEEKETFCKPYLATDAWTRILNGELSQDFLKFKCLNLYNKDYNETLTPVQLATCAKRMKESPSLCFSKASEGFASLYPMPNCSLISKALNKSRIKVPYHDCPGQVDNSAVTNIHRIMGHYLERDIVSTPEACQAEANLSLLNLLEQSKNTRGWPLKICYDDKIENKEVCHDYIPGNLTKTNISEDKIVTKILRRMTSISTSQKCEVTSKAKFNPVLLKYKNGCHIVFDEKNCSNAYCPKKIIVDEKPITGLRYRGATKFDYFPNNWRDQKKSGLIMLQEGYSLRSRKLRNLTELEVFFKQNKSAIVHGVGCAEDLLPRHFKRHVFSQCYPMPFILDGVLRENENMMLVTRTSIDDLHSPRLIPWNWIFTGVMKYKEKHPLNQWNLYGIK